MKSLLLASAVALASSTVALMAQTPPKPKGNKEIEAINAMIKATTPDERIQAADQLISKFSASEFKPLAMFLTAQAYELKNDVVKMEVWCEKTIEVDPKNYECMLMVAGGIAKHAKDTDLDLNEEIARSDKYAKSALDVLKDAAKPDVLMLQQMSDDQWAAAKKDLVAQAHEAFALNAGLRKKYDVAIDEFKQAIDGASKPDPATMVRLGQTYNLAHKPDEAIAILDKVMADPNVHPQIRQVAQAERVRAIQAKGAATPATPPPPATPKQ